MAWVGVALRRLRDDRAATAGLIVLVLIVLNPVEIVPRTVLFDHQVARIAESVRTLAHYVVRS